WSWWRNASATTIFPVLSPGGRTSWMTRRFGGRWASSVPWWCQQTTRRWSPPSGCCGTARQISSRRPRRSAKRWARWTRRPCRRRSGATAFWKTGWTGQRSGSLWSRR
ncbi:V-type ATP synthase subunit F, partial [Dysosmobacter welbionis]